MLRILRRKPVLPIAVVLLPGVDGFSWGVYIESLFGHQLLQFRFAQIGLRRLLSKDYVVSHNAIAAALATLMDFGDLHPAEVKLAALQTIIQSNLTEGDKRFLIHFVEAYLPKTAVKFGEEITMQQLADIETTWVEKALEEGIQRGIQRGRQEGRQEGRQAGKQEGKHELLLELMTIKFGPLPDYILVRIKQITDDEALRILSQQVLFANTLAEIKLPDEQAKTDSPNPAYTQL